MLKPNRLDSDVSNYRPLQISDQSCRTFCTMISNRLLTYVTNNKEYNLRYRGVSPVRPGVIARNKTFRKPDFASMRM